MIGRRSVSRSQRIDVLHAHSGICHICGNIINPAREGFEVEHVIPLALGGADDVSNKRPAHVECHAAKTKGDVKKIAKAKRVRAKFDGSYRAARHQLPCGRNHPFKKKLNGQVVRRDAERSNDGAKK